MKHLSQYCKKNKKGGRNHARLYPFAVLLFLLALFLGILFGSVFFSPWELFFGSGQTIFLYVRLPRTLASLVAGAALAVSGAVIQTVLSNRLASPSILGVNAGAGLAVTVCTALGFFGGTVTSLFAFLGAFGAVMLITLGARHYGASRGTVILAGVALNALFNAISSAIVTLFPEVGVMSNDFRIGDFSAITIARLIPAAILISVALLLLFTLSNELDLMRLGTENARGLGMNVPLMRTLLLLLAALLAGCAVSLAGLLSFVGLIVPHVVRMLGVTESRHLLPLCALFGGGFVTLCDLLARVLFAPFEIPVGIIMAFLGAPFFLFMLIRKKGGHGND